MNDQQESKTQLRAYLLGELESAAAEMLEERLFTEVGLSAAMQAERDDLLDEWANGELNAADATKLAARIDALPALREHANFARCLNQDFLPAAPATHQPRSVKSFFSFPEFQVSSMRWALTTALVVGGFAVVMFIWRARQSLSPVLPAHSPQSPPVSVSQTDHGSSETSPGRNNQKADVHRTPQHNTKEPEVASFVLAAGLVRSDENDAPELILPASAKVLRIQAELPTDSGSLVKAELQNAEGQVMWQGSQLRLQTVNALRYVACDIPVASVATTIYELRLTFTDGNVAAYRFQVRKN